MDMAAGRDEVLPLGLDRRPLSAVLAALTLGLIGGSLALSGAPPGRIAVSSWFAVTAVLGALIVRRAGSLVGWLIQIAIALAGLGEFAGAFAESALNAEPSWIVTSAAWMAHWLLVPAAGMFVFVFLLFPTGTFPATGWKVVAWAAAVGIGLVGTASAFAPGPMAAIPEIVNPVGIEGAAEELGVAQTVGSLILIAAVISVLISLFVRLRRAVGDEREQVKWLLFAATLLFLMGLFAMLAEGTLNELSFVGLLIGLFACPVALTVALTKYHLYDIDLVVNRTLVYSIVTAAVVVLYILIVGLMGALLQKRVGLVPALVATGIVAVVFQPLRRIAQSAIDRTMFGQRHDPYGALANLAGRLESTFDPQEILPAIVDTVARSLKLAYVAIEVEKEGRSEIAASQGGPEGTLEPISLVYQGDEVGRLIVAPRRGESLTAADRRTLADLARSAGPAVHAVALTTALRASRNELLATREEERRRLRRDLHDGLGPELAGITLGLGAAVNIAAAGEPETKELLDKLKTQAEAATRSIRSLVDGLRPAALDDLGLVGAVREKGTAIASRGGLTVEVAGPLELGELPAAVEVAAMRIALEAITNAVRHSSGTRCSVRIHVREHLLVEVEDDGSGLPAGARGGVGLLSMRERAEEVGGTLTLETPDGGGTIVRAVFPLS